MAPVKKRKRSSKPSTIIEESTARPLPRNAERPLPHPPPPLSHASTAALQSPSAGARAVSPTTATGSQLGPDTVPVPEPGATTHKKMGRSKVKKTAGAAVALDEDVDHGGDRKTRFIVFAGNLPYTATTSSVSAHFAAAEPTSVRLATRKEDPQRCKGFAFIEFASYHKMEICLTAFHHTLFDGRKINVELTAGGGGSKSKLRREKLAVKNRKLDEERQRLASERQKDKTERRAQAGDQGNGMHPSRRRRLQ